MTPFEKPGIDEGSSTLRNMRSIFVSLGTVLLAGCALFASETTCADGYVALGTNCEPGADVVVPDGGDGDVSADAAPDADVAPDVADDAPSQVDAEVEPDANADAAADADATPDAEVRPDTPGDAAPDAVEPDANTDPDV